MSRNAKVVARIKGGLGNQLFSYAAARRLALVNDAELVLDDVTGFRRDVKYRRKYMLDRFQVGARRARPAERMEPWERYRRGLAKAISRRRPYHRRRYVEQEGIDFDPRLLAFKVEGTVYLDGFWQSEGYFQDVAEVIQDDLRLIPPQDDVNRRMASEINRCNAVALHVRLLHGVGSAHSALQVPDRVNKRYTLGQSYYAKAAHYLRDRTTDPHFFLFSDQPDAARRLLDLADEKITCVRHNRGDEEAYTDLWLMTQCKHFIIANSTFSWWGAWLAPGDEKIVIAPDNGQSDLAYWGFQGLVPDRWTQVAP